MNSGQDKDAARFDVPTAEGSSIAVWVSGDGPAIVLVHGSMCDHTTFDALADELRGGFSVYAMDRRGFGASPEAGDYSAEREFGDVARVADAVAERQGGPVILFGHSWGASCAMGAAALTNNVSHLVVYEPSFGLKYPPGFIERVETQIAEGDPDGAMVSVLVDLAGMTEEQVADLRAAPSWPDRLETAPTVAREARIEDGWSFHKGQFDGISAPAIFITGDESPPDLAGITANLVTAVPGAKMVTLADHGHFAYKSEPAVVADAIREFAG